MTGGIWPDMLNFPAAEDDDGIVDGELEGRDEVIGDNGFWKGS